MMESKHEDESNKHEKITEGTTMSSELHPEVKPVDNKPTTEGIISGLEEHPEAKHDDTKPSTESTISGLEVQPEAKHDEDEAIIGEGKNIVLSSSPSSSSSSSSSSELDSPLALNGMEEDPLSDSLAKSDLPQSPRSGCTSPPDISTQTPQWSMISASPRAGPGNSYSRELLPPTPEWSMSNSSVMKSPITQTMSRPAGYDPNRIPSSIFSTKSTTPMEWSVASNESLFSIHMGNTSFSREHIVMLGDGKQEEWSNSPLHTHNLSEVKSESNSFTTNLAPVLESASENDRKNVDITEESAAEEESQKPPKIIPGERVEQWEKEKVSPGAQEAHLSTTPSNLSEGKGATPVEGTRNSVSVPRVSNESTNSSGSFAFPVLDTNVGGKSASLKAIAEKPEEPPQSQPQDPQPPPKAAHPSWFCCFSCWPQCC